MDSRSSPQQTIRLFQNDTLEAFTHVHPSLPAVFWLPIVGYLFYRASEIQSQGLPMLLVLAICGVFVWTFTEYVLHRFLFHFEARTSWGKRLVYLFHGIHHDAPQDLSRLVMPPLPAFFIGAGLFIVFRTILGPEYVEAFFGGFLIGYLIYDYTHYFLHRLNPKSKFGKALKQNHMIHHFVKPNSRWGVSSPLWDYVFGTHK